MTTVWTSQTGGALVLGIVISLVAYTDARVPAEMSVSYLYLVPLVLAGVVFRGWGMPAAAVVVCVVLREALGPFDHSGSAFVLRTIGVITTYATVVLVVSRIQARQRTLTELAAGQRRQLDRDLQEAATLQRHLIPSVIPDIPGWDLAARLYPARIVSGDFYDVIEDDHRRELAIVIADVGGKGAAAAMLMPVVQSAVRRLQAAGEPPEALTATLNAEVARVFDRPRLVSLVYLVIQTETGRVTYVNMGHPPPLLLGAESGVRWLSVGGSIAGARPTARYDEGVEQLSPGDVLLLYTDGATEAEDDRGDPFAADRLLAVATQRRREDSADLVAATHAAIESFRGSRSEKDDVTLVAIRRVAARRLVPRDPEASVGV